MNYIYELPPTDFFEGFTSEQDLIEDNSLSDIKENIERAKFLFARYTTWEGDGSCYISSIPSIDSFPLMFITIKQSNNGTTFLMSPIELNHLSKNLIVYK